MDKSVPLAMELSAYVALQATNFPTFSILNELLLSRISREGE